MSFRSGCQRVHKVHATPYRTYMGHFIRPQATPMLHHLPQVLSFAPRADFHIPKPNTLSPHLFQEAVEMSGKSNVRFLVTQ